MGRKVFISTKQLSCKACKMKFKKGDRVKFSRKYIAQFGDSEYKRMLCHFHGKILSVYAGGLVGAVLRYQELGVQAEFYVSSLKKID